MSESSAFYQMGRNRIPQIFYRPSYLTEEQIERLAIRTEDAIKNDIFCLVPESYVKCLFEDDFDFDRWENLCDEEEEYHEIYQYFFVSDWLGQALAKIGQTVYADDHAYVWGRRTYGQAIDIDCTIQRALSVAFGYETLNQDDEDQNDEDQNDEDQNDLED
jgi:hypothetical protein